MKIELCDPTWGNDGRPHGCKHPMSCPVPAKLCSRYFTVANGYERASKELGHLNSIGRDLTPSEIKRMDAAMARVDRMEPEYDSILKEYLGAMYPEGLA